jgi:amino-acid N-acetyltransferase
MKIIPVSPTDFSTAIDLLKKSSLPTEDITAGTQLFVMEDGETILGTVAAEYDYNNALLRSLSVQENKRKSGLGVELVRFIENYVQQQGVEAVYLLTTTAATFFLNRGYEIIDREEVPDFIKQTSEYCTVCPSSATVMRKRLS